MLSINQISSITKPLIWTFHDMWPMCGIEHYSDTSEYKDGYKKKNFLTFTTIIGKRKINLIEKLRLYV